MQSQGAIAYNGYLYAIGGEVGWSNGTDTIYYAPINATGSLGSWSQANDTAALTGGAGNYSCSFQNIIASNGYLYIIAPYLTSAVTSTIFSAPINGDGSLGTWSAATSSLNYSSGSCSTDVLLNGYDYYIPGSGVYTTVKYAKDMGSGTFGSWSSTTDTPYHPYYHSAAAINGSVYLIGGDHPNGSSTKNVYYAVQNTSTDALGSWATTTPMFESEDNFASVAYNGYIYALGGDPIGDGSVTSTVQYVPINPPINGLYRSSGTLDSVTYDTGVSGGANLNSILWHGNLPSGTSVKLQLAVSSSSNGPWTFVGSDGTSATWFTPAIDTPLKLSYTQFNGYRYFRYRVNLVADSSLLSTPRVDDVVVNWSP